MALNVRVRHKRDTASNWNTKNPVLLNGEIVLVDDNGTLRFKVGDGSTAYSGLPFTDAETVAHLANTSNPHGVTKTQLGLGNVDNTADINKSVKYAATAGGLTSVTATATELNILDGAVVTTTELNYLDGVTSAVQTQLNAKAALASPTLTGTPKAPTASAGTNTTQIATTAFVTTAVANKTSVSGNAGSADKLNTNAGGVTQPVYFANGVPVKTTYTLAASVPANAKFTDTTYSNATQTKAGLMSAEDKIKLDNSSATAITEAQIAALFA